MILNNFTEYKIEFCCCSYDSYKIYNMQYIGDIKIIETKIQISIYEIHCSVENWESFYKNP